MATTSERLTVTKGEFPHKGTYPVAANVVIYKGTIVQLDASNRAIPGAITQAGIAVGIAAATYNNTGGAAAAFDVEVEHGVHGLKANGTAPACGDKVFVHDNETVTLDAASAANGPAGIVAEVRDGLTFVHMSPTVAGLML